MKANELMIGDWVYEGNDHPIQVVRNYGRSIMYKEEYSNEVEETCLNPIPLTEDILKANGFECNGKHCHLSDADKEGGCIDIRFDFEEVQIEVVYAIFQGGVKYVHELQHALRICGLNDLADNFKIK